MNALQLLEALGSVDDSLLQKAYQPLPKKQHFAVRMAAAAASICLIASAAAWYWGHSAERLNSVSSTDATNRDIVCSEAVFSKGSNSGPTLAEQLDSSVRADVPRYVDLVIKGWNAEGFSAVVSGANVTLDHGTEVQVMMNENTVRLYSDNQLDVLYCYEINASNTAAGSQVKVVYSDFVQTDTGIQIIATTVTLYQQVKP